MTDFTAAGISEAPIDSMQYARKDADWVVVSSVNGTTYGPLTNVQILAIASPSDEETAFSTDDSIVYFFYQGTWYSTGGGALV